MNIKFDRIGAEYLTFALDGELFPGMVCTLVDNGTVGPAEEDDEIIGVVVKVKGDIATVQVSGYAELTFSGDAPDVGWVPLLADGEGAVAAAETGRAYLVCEVDEDNGVLGVFLK